MKVDRPRTRRAGGDRAGHPGPMGVDAARRRGTGRALPRHHVLARRRATAAYDGGAEGFDRYVDQIARALDSAGLERAAICGVSFGGLIAAAFAARYPERVTSLVLVSALPPSWKLDSARQLLPARAAAAGAAVLPGVAASLSRDRGGEAGILERRVRRAAPRRQRGHPPVQRAADGAAGADDHRPRVAGAGRRARADARGHRRAVAGPRGAAGVDAGLPAALAARAARRRCRARATWASSPGPREFADIVTSFLDHSAHGAPTRRRVG